jgi:hypothetical protein
MVPGTWTRPQTIGYGLADSPLPQLAWIAHQFRRERRAHPVRPGALLRLGIPAAVPQGFAVFGADETVGKLLPAVEGAHVTEFASGPGSRPASEYACRYDHKNSRHPALRPGIRLVALCGE